jgi:hypothetical protein
MNMQGIKLVQVAERRRHLRFDLDRFTCVTAVAGGRLYECQVADISLGGLRLRFAGPPPTEAQIALRHATAGELSALQVWQSGNELGLTFESSDRELEHLLQCISLILNPDENRIARIA